ncbi:MAG: diaminopimelate epimerase [Vicinamibacterales bacterium]
MHSLPPEARGIGEGRDASALNVPLDYAMLSVIKAHAYGNDFLYVRTADVESRDLEPVRLAVELCDRHTGVGADGLILFSDTPGGARMRLINSDGSRAEVSGNGVRALGAVLARQRALAAGTALTIDTDAGPKRLDLLAVDGKARYEFRANMGRPNEIERVALKVGAETIDAIRLDMGNPQCVIFEPLNADRLAALGRDLQTHPAFPDAVNVEIACVESRQHLRILIWERGAGATLSSGTGSCAAAVAAMTAGFVDRDVTVEAPGGAQRVSWGEDGVFLTGWAEVLLEGHWTRS